MKVEITREVYENLKGTAVKLDMECKYYIVIPSADDLPKRAKRRPLTKPRRDPLTQYVLSPKAGTIKMSTEARGQARSVAVTLDYPMAGGEIGEKIAKFMKCTRDMGSYYVSRLIEDKVLVPHD